MQNALYIIYILLMDSILYQELSLFLASVIDLWS